MARATILIADDNPELLVAYRRPLEHSGYVVFTARDAAGALEVLARSPVDVLVSDEHMPGMVGTDLLERVARDHPDVARILCTGDASSHTVIRAIRIGHVNQLLIKPFPARELLRIIERAITSPR